LIQLMKRTLAVVVTAGAIAGLAGTGTAGAAPQPRATLRVRILKVLGGFWQPDQPGLPKQFKPGRDGLQRTAARQEAAPH
jgi:hypothetical protein